MISPTLLIARRPPSCLRPVVLASALLLVGAVLVSLATHFWRRRSGYRLRLWQVVAINFIVSAVASVAAIMVLGRDGTMSGYAALVLAAASTQWVLGRGWRG